MVRAAGNVALVEKSPFVPTSAQWQFWNKEVWLFWNKEVRSGMAEYIEREIALDIVKRTSGDYAAAFAEIAHHSAADVAPVRHGQWVLRRVRNGHFWECSACHINPCIYVTQDTKYCPNCGAKMDGWQDDG